MSHERTLPETARMFVSASSWVFFAACTVGLLMTVTGLVRATRLGWGNMPWFLSGWLTSELALFHMLLSALVMAGFAAATDALQSPPGRLGLGLMALSWVGLALLQWRARPTGLLLEDALRKALGADYRDRIPPARRALLRDRVPTRELLQPFALRSPGVERIARRRLRRRPRAPRARPVPPGRRMHERTGRAADPRRRLDVRQQARAGAAAHLLPRGTRLGRASLPTTA